MMADPIATWSSLLASPQAPKTAMSALELDGYLTDVLTKLVNLWPASRLDELMPWAWAAERGRSLAA